MARIVWGTDRERATDQAHRRNQRRRLTHGTHATRKSLFDCCVRVIGVPEIGPRNVVRLIWVEDVEVLAPHQQKVSRTRWIVRFSPSTNIIHRWRSGFCPGLGPTIPIGLV
jgi:hypothetical protein